VKASDAEERKLDILVKPKDVATKSALRTSYMEKYAGNKDKYRKTGESPFGNAEEAVAYYRKAKEKDMKLYFCAHNILAYFSNK